MPDSQTSQSWLRRHPGVVRITAVALGLSVFLIIELVLRLAGIGKPADYEDPFVGFSGLQPLFQLNPAKSIYEIPKAKLKFFSPESFPAEKGPKTFRTFVFGGSTVKGRPYSKETSFTTWLELDLQAADPRRDWEVINCGGISYASYRLVPILEECLAYEPDLVIICTGHNEFLEDRSYEAVRAISPTIVATHGLLSHSRLYNASRSAVAKLRGENLDSVSTERFVLPGEVEALLDYRGGLEVYDRNDAWKADVIRHYGHNVRAMIAQAKSAGIPVMLVLPPSNLRDSPPFKSLNRDDLTLDERVEWERLTQEAASHFRDDLPLAVKLLREANQIDPRHAGNWYQLGKCLEAQGRRDEARAAFLEAREQDICPLRMVNAQEELLRQIASETDTPLVDAHQLLEQESRLHILGNDQLVDHIHPSIEGHQQIADALLMELEAAGIARRGQDWQTRRDESFKAHRAALPDDYFIAAQRALFGLQSWAAGRVDGPPVESRKPEFRQFKQAE